MREVELPSSLHSCEPIIVSALEMRFRPMRICLGTKENKHESKSCLLKAEKNKLKFLILKKKITRK